MMHSPSVKKENLVPLTIFDLDDFLKFRYVNFITSIFLYELIESLSIIYLRCLPTIINNLSGQTHIVLSHLGCKAAYFKFLSLSLSHVPCAICNLMEGSIEYMSHNANHSTQ